MSQNKTRVPGMEGTNGAFSRESEMPNAYGKSGMRNDRQTYYPGMDANAPGYKETPNSNSQSTNGKPVVGFLYSISKRGIGEYWPLYVGPNTIGRSPNCSICLSEGTVSDEHAVLVIRKMKNPEKLVASITDAKSTCGTMIDGVSLGFASQECFNNNIITIGENYELLLILIDTKEFNLKVAENFILVDEPQKQDNSFFYQSEEYATNTEFSHNSMDNFYSYEKNDGTVGLDGSRSANAGKTKYL